MKRKGFCFFHFFWRVCCLLFIPCTSFAQFYAAGVDPAAVHWNQVNEDGIRIIFPKGYEPQAMRLLEDLKEVKREATETLPADLPSISVVLHNQTAQSNGFVAWAPKRMELFTMADQNTYPQEWLRQLAIHEFRHVVQISTLRQGLTKVLSVLLGEQAIGGVLGLYVPAWFLEGDAVSFETAYSKTGRGRTPTFFIPYIAMLNKYGSFSYEKAVFGSYRHFVPNHYVVGYHLVSYTRYYYGERVWQTALNRVAQRPYSITPFSFGIRKWTGRSKFQWYPHIARQIEGHYRPELVPVSSVSRSFLGDQDVSDFVSYRFPHYLNDSTVIAEKSGLSYVKEWVKLSKDGKEEHVLYPGYYSLANTSYSQGRLFYTEYRFDKRWSNRVWNDVRAVDVHRKRKSTLTRRCYAAAPAVAHSRMAYVQQNREHVFSLVVEELEGTGRQTFAVPEQEMPFTPAWESDSTLVLILLKPERGKYFSRLHLKSGRWEALTAPAFYDINQPVCWKHYILYRGAYEATEQLYAFDTNQRTHHRITREPYEATDPSVQNDRLLFASYTASGFQLKEQVLDTLQWTDLALNQAHWDNAITASMSLQEQKAKPHQAVDTSYGLAKIKRYRKATHLFNFHSWAPLYIDIDNAQVASGASVFSQNLLSTSFLSAGYAFNHTEQTGKYLLNYRYTGLYPVLAFSTSIGDRFMKRYGHWREFVFNANISLPLNLTRGPFAESLVLSVLPQWQSIYDVQKENAGGLINQDLWSMTYRIDYSRLFRLAPRDLRSKWGQSFFLEYRHAPVSDFSHAGFWAGAFSVWLPSFAPHHSVLLKAQAHLYERGGYYLSSPVAFPRGYFYQFSPELYRGSLDYSFPVAYPDWRLSPLLYIKRFKMNLFYDAALAYSENSEQRFYDSKGIDLRMDCHIANFLAPLDIGLRVYFLNVDNFPNYQFLFAYQIQ